MNKRTDQNAYYKTKTSSILNELPHLPNTGFCFRLDHSSKQIHCDHLTGFISTIKIVLEDPYIVLELTILLHTIFFKCWHTYAS